MSKNSQLLNVTSDNIASSLKTFYMVSFDLLIFVVLQKALTGFQTFWFSRYNWHEIRVNPG